MAKLQHKAESATIKDMVDANRLVDGFKRSAKAVQTLPLELETLEISAVGDSSFMNTDELGKLDMLSCVVGRRWSNRASARCRCSDRNAIGYVARCGVL